MKTRYHAIPRHLFNALAGGGGGSEAISALVAAQHSKHILLLRGVLAAARDADSAQARYARLGWEVLAEVERRDRAAAARVASYPAVGAWATRVLNGRSADGSAPEATASRLAAVGAAAAIQSGLEVEVPVLPGDGVVALPSLGAARVTADSAVVRSHTGGAQVRWARGEIEIPVHAQRDTPAWQGIRRCRAGPLEAVIEDLDSFRMPAVAGLAPRLTARQARMWASTLQQGWRVLAAGHPAVAAEVAAAISAIVPLRSSVYRQLSSSSPETFGAVAMSKPADPVTCACTLTHELQHLKLIAILDIAKLTLPDDGRRYYAPWRADPRPVAGLLQGTYAYLGVTEFWRRQRQRENDRAQVRTDVEFALWRTGTERAIDTLLSSNRLTPVGLDFVQRMAEAAGGWASEPVPAKARAVALRESRRHLARWETEHGPVLA